MTHPAANATAKTVTQWPFDRKRIRNQARAPPHGAGRILQTHQLGQSASCEFLAVRLANFLELQTQRLSLFRDRQTLPR